MAAGFNKVILMGNLTRDPRMSATSSGTSVCNMTLAVNGSKKDDVEFVEVTAWDKVADLCGQYLSKGRQCLVDGRLTTSKWVDKKTGENRSKLFVTAHAVQFIGSSKDATGPQEDDDNEEENINDETVPF